jgi:hypothetical protein
MAHDGWTFRRASRLAQIRCLTPDDIVRVLNATSGARIA